ncbi:tyrosinase cofactor [Streptomyces sp. LP05-1]|uniref:Tyrosinase cofactor n=1 Tax=Streptomyces pyxinae TaxID=2970734 RepID=A0ABT2CPH0_9ACTN|nr:tyrosinase cofactor [Streptomyces sp. LP05-1]MCS0638972.1 tyrosinase cofactor [Streptomyces sp. LP05-1]
MTPRTPFTPSTSGPVRRGVLRALFALVVTGLTGGALARIAAAPPTARPEAGAGRAGAEGGGLAGRGGFDEMYRGRRIQGRPAPARTSYHGPAYDVLIDGRPLHLMRCADGGYLSVVDHYRSCPTPLDAARAAVDELGSARLAPAAAVHGAGVRAAAAGDGGVTEEDAEETWRTSERTSGT